jgi:glycosyltransferase involved in cell wall biosynthesis
VRGIRVLIVAENASAVFGGEALIPLQYFRCLREIGVDVHLLVHARTREELLTLFQNEIERLHFVADSFINRWCYKISKILPERLAAFTLGSISHFDTQVRQRRVARTLIETHHFEIVHEPIPVSPKVPSMMFGLSVPVIIGPMNGGMDYPPNYGLDGYFERLSIFILRSTANFWNRVIPGKLNATLLLVANKRSYDALPSRLQQKRVVELPENGVDLNVFLPLAHNENLKTVNIIYVGALIDLKRVDLLVGACARLVGKVDFRLDIVGDGPERRSLEARVRVLSLTSRVTFHGRLSHGAVAAMLCSAYVMVFPSMRECGGAVVLEAMASGVPVIAANWGGPATYIDVNTGILVSPATPRVFVDELANAILRLAQNPQVRAQMSKAARQHVQQYDWRAKAKAILDIYKNVLSEK